MFSRFLAVPLLIAVIAIGMGSGIDAIVKAVAPEAGLMHLLAWRFLFGGLISLIVFRAKRRPMPSAESFRFHTMRGLFQLGGAFLFFFALTRLPLAEATIIGFTAALMVPFVARVLLAEKISGAALVGTCVGFGGAVLAVSGVPVDDTLQEGRVVGLVACFAAAFLYAVILVLLRMRATKEDATTIAMFTNVVPAIFLLPITFGAFGAPEMGDIPVFALLGALGFAVWYLLTLAYARAPAQQLAPLEYTALIWSALFGAVFFSEMPGWRLWAGAAIIIGACLLVAFENRFATRREAGLPASDLPE
jgi:S-adenosylmethionine uptake transporter